MIRRPSGRAKISTLQSIPSQITVKDYLMTCPAYAIIICGLNITIFRKKPLLHHQTGRSKIVKQNSEARHSLIAGLQPGAQLDPLRGVRKQRLNIAKLRQMIWAH